MPPSNRRPIGCSIVPEFFALFPPMFGYVQCVDNHQKEAKHLKLPEIPLQCPRIGDWLPIGLQN